MLSTIDARVFLHASGFLAFVALTLRDQLKLRFVLLLSTTLAVVYGFELRPPAAWEDLIWNDVAFFVNLWVLTRLFLDRTHLGLSAEEERLFTAFGSLSPGQFRQLLKLASWHTAEGECTLTREGVLPDHLFYVLDGSIRIAKGDRRTPVDARTFIGEIAFLRQTPASATVTVEPGTRYVAWPVPRLSRSLARQDALRIALLRAISADMALKVARA